MSSDPTLIVLPPRCLPLARRQDQVLYAHAHGLSYRAIGRIFGFDRLVAREHLRRIARRWRCRLAEVADLALDEGYLHFGVYE